MTGFHLTFGLHVDFRLLLYMTVEVRPLYGSPYGTPDDVILFSPIISVEETKFLVPPLYCKKCFVL